MRRLIGWLGVLALLWSGWWALASWGVSHGLTIAVEELRAQGWQADVGETQQAGFPLTLRADLSAVRLRAPLSGIALSLPSLGISAPAYWPGDVTLRLPQERLHLDLTQQKVSGRFERGRAQINLNPGIDLQLQRLGFDSGSWQIEAPGGTIASASDLSLKMVQSAGDPLVYDLALVSTAFAPGNLLRRALSLPPDWPVVFSTLAADLSVGFDRPLDRAALTGPRPHPRAVLVRQADAEWGALQITATADLSISARGVPEGVATLRIREWELLMDLAQKAAGSEDQPGQMNFMLRALANMDGDPTTMVVDVAFRDGAMFLGPIALGPAPRLVLR